MFRASSAHLQEDKIVHMQRMAMPLCKQVSDIFRFLYCNIKQIMF